MKRGRLRGNGGFTLAEVIVVMAVIGVFAAVASLSMVGFIVQGGQISRANVARTLYLAAQNQLTELRITKGLESELAEFCDDTNLVSPELGSDFPDTEDNKDNVYYISKSAGSDTSNPVFKLLAPQLIDPEVLQGAILIEFNIKTGVVMSVFYSDTLSDGDSFKYEGDNNDPANILGGRGMPTDVSIGYEWAEVRGQGYYGIGNTGSLLDEVLPALINVWDSYSAHPVDSITSRNILFAEILIPKDYCDSSYELLINGNTVHDNVKLSEILSTDLGAAITNLSNPAALPVYKAGNGDLDEEYERFIWVLDAVTGNSRYAVDGDKNIRVGIKGGDKVLIDLTSVTMAHPYFLTEAKSSYGGSYKVASERHLNNIRHIPDGSYTLAESITMSEITNFKPIPGFTGLFNGEFNGEYNEIIDLKSHAISGGAGLFESITGEKNVLGKFTKASVLNLTITNPEISGTDNTGALCGSANAFISGITVNNPTIDGKNNVGGVAGSFDGLASGITVNNPVVDGENNVGGVVGLSGGSVTGAYINCEDAASSITGGSNVGGIAGQNDGKLLDSTFISPNNTPHISGASNTGGVAGLNGVSAEIRRVLFLALAPENASGISPVAGANANPDDTKLEKLYYLRGEGVRPEVTEYNTTTATPDIGTPIGTSELYSEMFSEPIGTGWKLKDSSLTEAQVTADESTVYPYPYFERSEAALAERPNWPIVDGVELGTSSFSYYEKYSDNSYGFWTLVDGYGDGLLNNDKDKKVVEAGYVLLLDSAPSGYYLFAKPGDSADSSWTSSDSIEKMDFFPIKIKEENKYAYTLPLEKLVEKLGADKSVPMKITYIPNINGGTPDEGTVEFIHPLFAMAIYGKKLNPEAFYIRTPWQMSNINELIKADKTKDRYFIQRRDLDLSQTGDYIGASYTYNMVSGEFKGHYKGEKHGISGFIVNNGDSYAGLFKNNSGAISGIILSGSTINVNNIIVGGIAGTNTGEISDCELNNVEISGAQYTGGIAGTNTGKISDCKLNGVIVSGKNNDDVGGIAGTNTNEINQCEVSDSTVTAMSRVGGITGNNTGSIVGGKVKNTEVETHSNGGYFGGIAGTNANEINQCEVSGSTVTAMGRAGGIAGDNNGSIVGSRVENTEVITSSNGEYFGGIAGTNTNEINQCEVSDSTVTAMGRAGGITGDNNGSIVGSRVESTEVKTKSNGEYFGGIAGTNTKTIDSCRVVSVDVQGVSYLGGVSGSNTGTISKSCVEFSTVKTTNGSNIGGIVGDNQDSGTVSNVYFLSTATLENIPISGSGGGIAGNNSGSVSYAMYLAPAPKDSDNKIYPIIRSGNSVTDEDNKTTCFYLVGHRYSTNDGTTWISTYYNRGESSEDVTCEGGGQRLVTKFIDKEWLDYVFKVNLSEWFQPSVGYPYPMIIGMTPPVKWVEADSPARPEQVDKDEWGTTEPTSNRAANVAFGNGDFSAAYTGTGSGVIDQPTGNRRVYIDMADVDGWYTRPVNQSDYSGTYGNTGFERWKMIELQEPIFRSNYVSDTSSGNYYGEYAYTNYQGNYNNPTNINNSPYRYAELNADVQGTLYQLCPTTPGAQFYYSFYHMSRTNGANNNEYADDMNFYLTGVSSTAEHADDNELVLIRPCRSPRTKATQNPVSNDKNTLINNPSVRKTVDYGNTNDLSYYKGMFTDFPENGRPYLYDVWISGLGYGITFWSNNPVSNINANGVSSISNLPAAAASNIIGYWGISYGWKHYYGLYTVPEGQERTEFAYQSRRADAQNGNYLDGISFKSPAFVSVDKYVRMGAEDVKFVKPGDVVKVELNVKNWGEVPAKDIKISDVIEPFTEYIEVVGGALKVSGSLSGSAGVDASGSVSVDINGNLAQGEEVKITFDVKVLKEVESTPGVSTLLFYFKNQASVTYNDSGFDAYMSKEKVNNSGVVQVHIDPIKLSIGVTPEIGTMFNVDLLVKDTLVEGNSIKTTGLVNVVVPKQFEVSGLQDGSISKDSDGSSRITIKDVNLDEKKNPINNSYSLSFDGSGYGVLYTTLSSDYKYQYVDEGGDPLSVKLNFPQPVVGIKAAAMPFNFSLPGTSTSVTILDISKGFKSMAKYTDDNYDVTPEFLLFDENKNRVSNLVDNNYNITNENYKATLMRGSNNIEFVPLKPGEYTLYYQIYVKATKPGSEKSFDLSSEIVPITITVVDTSAATQTSFALSGSAGEDGGLPVQLPLGAAVVAGVSFGLFERRKKRGEHEKTN